MIKQVITIVVTTLLGMASLCCTSTLAAPQKPESLLFVQGAKGATLTPKDNKLGTYELKLEQVDPYVSYFTDAPKRATGQMLTSEFYINWYAAKIKFKPNVAMQSIDTSTKMSINRIFTLSAPAYDKKARTVTYQATLLGEQGLPKAVLHLGYTELFIDDLEWDGNKFHHSGN